MKSAEYHTEYREQDFGIDCWDDYQVIECQGCRTICFRKRHRDTEHLLGGGESEELEVQVDLYPARVSGRTSLDGLEKLPNKIQSIYSETLTALRADLPILAGIGIRALVEAICNDQSVDAKNLEQRIDGLVANGVVTRAGAETLHGLRLMGNLAAHETLQPVADDLSLALDVLEHVLTGVYVLPSRTKGLPRRKRAL